MSKHRVIDIMLEQVQLGNLFIEVEVGAVYTTLSYQYESFYLGERAVNRAAAYYALYYHYLVHKADFHMDSQYVLERYAQVTA